jgi:7-keto-8-aminopelargonate synthetase-like enzyme
LEVVRSQEGADLLQRLRTRLAQFQKQAGLTAPSKDSPIIPLTIGDESAALSVAERLWEAGIFVPAIRYPTVARGKARLRFTFSASHETADIERLTQTLKDLGQGR